MNNLDVINLEKGGKLTLPKSLLTEIAAKAGDQFIVLATEETIVLKKVNRK